MAEGRARGWFAPPGSAVPDAKVCNLVHPKFMTWRPYALYITTLIAVGLHYPRYADSLTAPVTQKQAGRERTLTRFASSCIWVLYFSFISLVDIHSAASHRAMRTVCADNGFDFQLKLNCLFNVIVLTHL
jgi:hypothetical protein